MTTVLHGRVQQPSHLPDETGPHLNSLQPDFSKGTHEEPPQLGLPAPSNAPDLLHPRKEGESRLAECHDVPRVAGLRHGETSQTVQWVAA